MTSEQVKEMQQAFEAFKQANDAAQTEVKKYGRESGELREKVSKLQTVMDDLEAQMNRKGGDAGEREGRHQSQKMKMFGEVLRGKYFAFDDLKSKGLISGDDTRGGYLAPFEYSEQIVADITEWSPLREVCTVRSTSRAGVQIPKKTGSAAASWVSETGSRTETTNPSFGLAEIRVHELYANVPVSRQEVEDSVFDLERFLRAEYAEAFGLAEGTAFVSGSGIGQPEGVTINANVSFTKSGHATQITADGLIGLFYDIKTPYSDRGTWALNRATLREVRKLKDGQGNYLWAAGIKTDARPATILDRPYILCPDLQDIDADTFPVVFGDFRRGYQIVDRVSFEIQVDPITSKSTGMIEFSARKRVGGQVVLPEAIRRLKIAA